MWSYDRSRISILAQSNLETESVIYNHCFMLAGRNRRFSEVTYHGPRRKKITSTHLFRNQPSHALPIVHGDHAYTSMGQSFEFLTGPHLTEPQINIKYKDKRILRLSGKHKVLFEKHHDQSLIHVVMGLSKSKVIYPAERDLTFTNLRDMVFSSSSYGLAYSLHPGIWRILQNTGRHQADDLSELEVTLAPYERVLRSTINERGAKLLVFSDANYGGDGKLKHVYCDENQSTNGDTVYKFGDKADNLTALGVMEDSNVFGVHLDEQGDPATLVSLTKSHGNYSKRIINLDDIMAMALELDAGRVFG